MFVKCKSCELSFYSIMVSKNTHGPGDGTCGFGVIAPVGLHQENEIQIYINYNIIIIGTHSNIQIMTNRFMWLHA